MAAEQALQHRAERHFTAVSHTRLGRIFGEWARPSHVNASISHLDGLLEPCKDAFCKPAHERSPDEVSAVLQLLQGLQQFDDLCRDAQSFIALHAQLLVLQEGVELCGLPEEEPPRMFSVVCGSVQLLHGSLDSPELQQLLHTAREHWQADKAARIEADTQEQLCTQASPAAASNVSVPAQSSSPAAVHDTSLEGHVASSSCAMPRCAAGTGLSASLCHHPGAWQRVMAAVSKGSRGQLHYSPDTNRVHARASQATSGSPPLQQQQQEQARHQAQHRTGAAGPAAADWRGAPAAAASGAAAVHESSLSLTVASRGQSFCVSKFVCGSPSAESMLMAVKAPSTCIAAAAAPNCVAGVLVVSKPVHLEALRLHQELQLARVLDTICRIPAFRHAPLKELTRLGAHLKESTYSKGQLILRQGQEASDTYIHFVLKGSVSLTYSAAVSQAAARAAARASLSGAQPATGPAQCSTQAPGGPLAQPAAAAAAGRFSGLAQVLRLEQTCFAPPAVLATRGPGAVLGDDAVRDKRLAVGVVAAEEGVVTLRVAPQKFLSTLDPLTLRLFTRLRQQEEEALQVALTAAAAAAAAQTSPGQQQPGELRRLAVLTEVYNKDIPSTLLRPGAAGEAVTSAAKQRPAWHSLRGKPATPEPDDGGTPAAHSKSRGAVVGPRQGVKQASKQLHQQRQRHQTEGVYPTQQSDAAWEAQLPAGMTADKCVGLPQTASVRQFVELIRDAAVYRKMNLRALGASTAAITACAATAAAQAASTSLAGTAGGNFWARPPALLEPAAAAAAAAAAAMAACGSSGSSRHTELQEGCCVAVLRLQVLPGQASVGMAALSGILDDVYSACGAAAYDEGVQLVRWGVFTFILLAPLDPGVPEAAGVECAADVLLATAARLAGLMLRAEGTLPFMRLAAGLALGSCFLDFEAGTFISAVSGRAFTAAEQLCEAACSIPTWTLPLSGSPDSSPSTCQALLLVSDGVASILQSGCGYSLQALPGSLMLLSARAALPHALASAGSSSGRPQQQQQPQTSRQTLGPGRHTVLGLGGGMGLPAVTPKTPTNRRRAGSMFGGARVHRRRQIRRKFEAMASFLAGAGDMLPPPPESLLTQPPPPAQTAAEGGTARPAGGPAAAAAAGGPSMGFGRARAVDFAGSQIGGSSSSSSSGPAGGKARPKLSISLEAAGVAGNDDGFGLPGSPGSPNKPGAAGSSSVGLALLGPQGPRKAATSPVAGRPARKGVAGKLTWAAGGASQGAQQPRSSSPPAAAAASAAAVAGAAAFADDSDASTLKQGAVAAARSNMQAAEQGAGRRAAAGTHVGGVKHAPSLSGAASATRSSTDGLARHAAADNGKLLQHAPLGLTSSSGSGGHAAAISASGSSHMRARQQVWQEVQAMRAAGSLSGSGGGGGASAAAAAEHGPAKLSASGGTWCNHARALCLGDGLAAFSARPCSPLSMSGIPTASGKPGSPQPQPLATAGGSSSSSLLNSTAAAAQPALDSYEASDCRGVCILKWGSGASLLGLTGGQHPHTQGSSIRASSGIEKAVCFLTPRTQAVAAAAAAAAAAASTAMAAPVGAWDINGHRPGQPGQPSIVGLTHNTAGVQQVSSSTGLVHHSQQQGHGHIAAHSTQQAQAAAAATGHHSSSGDSRTGASSSHDGGHWHSGDGSSDGAKQQQQPQLRAEQQQLLVHAACKSLGNAAAAEAFVAALPEGTECLNFSASGLLQLPSPHGFRQLETLTASFNKLSALVGLRPANQDAICLAAAAAAAADVEDQLQTHMAASATSSRPGSHCGLGAQGQTQQDAAALAATAGSNGLPQPQQQQQQQQHAGGALCGSRSLTVTPGTTHRPQSAGRLAVGPAGEGRDAYTAAYEQHVLRLTQLLAVPPGVSVMPPSLLQLSLAHNQLQQVPYELPAALPALTLLDLSHNRLSALPQTLGALSGLKALLLAGNQLRQLPSSTSRLQQLHTLHAGHNELQQLPAGLAQLSGLSSLHLQHNQLQALPEGFCQLSALSSLGLGFNQLQQLPQGLLHSLSGLKSLDLSGNGLGDAALHCAAEAAPAPGVSEAAAAAAGQSVVATSQAARSSCCSSSTGAAAAAACTADSGLEGSIACAAADASSQRRPWSPALAAAVEGPAMGHVLLPNLLALDVSCNRLTQLPPWLTRPLVWLVAAHNSITAVPGALCEQLTGSLQGLELQHNQLQDLPSELKAMDKLQLLSLAGNPGLHPDVADRSSGLVWAYRWLAVKKQAVASAAVKASQLHKYH